MSSEGGSGTAWGIWFHAVAPVPELVSLAVRGEELGAGAFLLADEGIDRDLYVTLTAVAVATRSITLVPAITNPHSRHPVATAAALGSLAEVAPGRVVVGLGAGGNLVFRPMGLDPRRPFTALAEAVEVIDELLAGKTVDHEGEFRAVGARLDWTPGRLPMAVAGRGPKVERLAARRGDLMIVSGKPVDEVAGLARTIRSEAARDGRRPRIVWNPMLAWRPEHVHQIRGHFSYMTVDMPEVWRSRLGIGDELVAELREALGAVGPEGAAHLVPDSVLENFAVVGERDEVVARLRKKVEDTAVDLIAFGANEYSLDYIDEVAGIAEEVGLVATHEALLSDDALTGR